LCLLFSVRGRKYLILDKIIKYLTRDDNSEVFQLPLTFWYKLGVLIESHKTRRPYIDNIRLLFDESFYMEKRDLFLKEIEEKIVDYCRTPKTGKEIANLCGFKNSRDFEKKYLEKLVLQNLIKYENETYIA